MPRLEFLRELALFVKRRKVYWLAPILVLLMLFGLVLVYIESSAVAPFIYTLF